MQTSSLLSVAYSNNSIILFPTQYKNDNTAFQWSFSSVWWSLDVASFCQWKIEHQVRKCYVDGLILRNMAGRERDAGRLYESGTSSSVASPKFCRGQIL